MRPSLLAPAMRLIAKRGTNGKGGKGETTSSSSAADTSPPVEALGCLSFQDGAHKL